MCGYAHAEEIDKQVKNEWYQILMLFILWPFALGLEVYELLHKGKDEKA
jgi:hypothetical protein